MSHASDIRKKSEEGRCGDMQAYEPELCALMYSCTACRKGILSLARQSQYDLSARLCTFAKAGHSNSVLQKRSKLDLFRCETRAEGKNDALFEAIHSLALPSSSSTSELTEPS